MRTKKLIARVGLGVLALLAAACATDVTAPALSQRQTEQKPATIREMYPQPGTVVDEPTPSESSRSGYMVTSGRHVTR